MIEKREGFYLELLDLLKQDPGNRFYSENGKDLLRNKLYECAMKMDKDLIKLLLSNERIKNKFFTDVDGLLVFDKTAFGWAINNKAFLNDSYTRFKNTIGLIDSSEQFISSKNDVVLSFPYKDCVLEGGQTKEDQKRDEIYYNELLAPDDVDRLLAPKVFTNAKRYTKDGEELITSFNDNDNLLIKGNNLLALSSILKRYEGKVKCIYIDPPYNTGNDGFNYNDNFNHSSWLCFMKTRLEYAKKMLLESGLIAIQITDYEQAYLKILCDEIYGRDNFIEQIIWKKRAGAPNDKVIGAVHEYILLYAKNKDLLQIYKKRRTEKQLNRYSNPDNHPKGPWAADNLMANVKGGRFVESLYFPIINPNTGQEHYPSSNGNWRFNKEKIDKLMQNNEIYFGIDGRGKPKLKRFLCDLRDGIPYSTLWDDVDLGVSGTAEIKSVFGSVNEFDTAKPENLIKQLLLLATKEGDIVLDFFSGSGTTLAVAQKMNRLWVGVEQLNYIESITKFRLNKVITGDKVGISSDSDIDWQGGGSFVYCELKELNQKYIDEIMPADDNKLVELYSHITESEFINYKVDINKLKEGIEDFKQLETEEKRHFLIEVLDKNLLYVNYSDIEDEDFCVSEEEKNFTKSFYGAV